MPNTAEADKRLVAWLKERTDRQLERILGAPEDGLTNRVWFYAGKRCLYCWAVGNTAIPAFDPEAEAYQDMGASELLESLGLPAGARTKSARERTIFRRIKAYVAAELLTRRVNRKRLPAPQASVDPVNEVYALEAEV